MYTDHMIQLIESDTEKLIHKCEIQFDYMWMY